MLGALNNEIVIYLQCQWLHRHYVKVSWVISLRLSVHDAIVLPQSRNARIPVQFKVELVDLASLHLSSVLIEGAPWDVQLLGRLIEIKLGPHLAILVLHVDEAIV